MTVRTSAGLTARARARRGRARAGAGLPARGEGNKLGVGAGDEPRVARVEVRERLGVPPGHVGGGLLLRGVAVHVHAPNLRLAVARERGAENDLVRVADGVDAHGRAVLPEAVESVVSVLVRVGARPPERGHGAMETRLAER